jgi:nucleoside-diphosphate-sugar epimerase
MKVLVIGSTGIAGRNIIPQLISARHTITAMVRNKDDLEKYSKITNKSIIGDILDINSLDNAMKNCECVINLATAIPNWEETDKIRNEGTKNLVKIALKYNVKIIQQSIIYLYGDQKDNIVDENTQIQPFELIQSASNMEDTIINSGVEYIILRGGTFYGEETGTEDNWYNLAKENKLLLSDNEFSYNSLINVNDYTNACTLAVNSKHSKTIYNVVDDYNVNDNELYDYINSTFDNGKTKNGGMRFLPSLRVLNEKIKKELNWKPIYNSYKITLINK